MFHRKGVFEVEKAVAPNEERVLVGLDLRRIGIPRQAQRFNEALAELQPIHLRVGN